MRSSEVKDYGLVAREEVHEISDLKKGRDGFMKQVHLIKIIQQKDRVALLIEGNLDHTDLKTELASLKVFIKNKMPITEVVLKLSSAEKNDNELSKEAQILQTFIECIFENFKIESFAWQIPTCNRSLAIKSFAKALIEKKPPLKELSIYCDPDLDKETWACPPELKLVFAAMQNNMALRALELRGIDFSDESLAQSLATLLENSQIQALHFAALANEVVNHFSVNGLAIIVNGLKLSKSIIHLKIENPNDLFNECCACDTCKLELACAGRGEFMIRGLLPYLISPTCTLQSFAYDMVESVGAAEALRIILEKNVSLKTIDLLDSQTDENMQLIEPLKANATLQLLRFGDLHISESQAKVLCDFLAEKRANLAIQLNHASQIIVYADHDKYHEYPEHDLAKKILSSLPLVPAKKRSSSNKEISLIPQHKKGQLRVFPNDLQLARLGFTPSMITTVLRQADGSRILNSIKEHVDILCELKLNPAQCIQWFNQNIIANLLQVIKNQQRLIQLSPSHLEQKTESTDEPSMSSASHSAAVKRKHPMDAAIILETLPAAAQMAETKNDKPNKPAKCTTKKAKVISRDAIEKSNPGLIKDIENLNYSAEQITKMLVAAKTAECLTELKTLHPLLFPHFTHQQIIKMASSRNSILNLKAVNQSRLTLIGFGFSSDQIVKMAAQNYGYKILDIIVGNMTTFTKNGFTVDLIVKMAANEFGNQNLMSALSHADTLLKIGFHYSQIARLNSGRQGCRKIDLINKYKEVVESKKIEIEYIISLGKKVKDVTLLEEKLKALAATIQPIAAASSTAVSSTSNSAGLTGFLNQDFSDDFTSSDFNIGNPSSTALLSEMDQADDYEELTLTPRSSTSPYFFKTVAQQQENQDENDTLQNADPFSLN